MGMAAAKSTNFLASIFRVRLPFHAFTYSTINTGSRDYVQNPNQNRNQFLQSVRDVCKARAFRNLDHALHLFDTMLHMRPLPSIMDFNQLLGAIARMKHYSEVITLIREMESLGILSQMGSVFKVTIAGAVRLVVEMEKKGYKPNVITYGTDDQRIDEAMHLFHEMSNKGMIPNVVTYNTLIGGFCRVGRPQAALEFFDKMRARGQHPDLQTYGILLDGLCKNKCFDEAMTLFQEMEDNKLHPNIVIYSILIDGLFNVGKLTTAREVFYSLPTKGLQPNVRTYTIMIKGLCQEGLIDEASELLEKMDENGCSPNDRTYNRIIQGLLQHNETSKAMKYLQIMVDKGFSANATTVAMLFDLLSSNQVDNNIQEFFRKFV
uniref:Pentacotripeptide-repeat region of PRORP domain-containing protein n=1 Tax=Fagus sylvatica TaxID=28930 RepID=A0A2N9FGH7_FAGSY